MSALSLGRLYKLLDVDPSSTSEEIRAAFDKMSLREQFHQAYFVVGHDHRKRLYDIGGERVVDYLISKSWGPIVTRIGATWSLRLYGLFLLGGCAAAIAWFVMLALKVDNVASLEWLTVFIPAFVLVAGNLLGHLLSLYCSLVTTFPEEASDGPILDRLPAACNVIAGGCYAAFTVLVALAVDQRHLLTVPAASNKWWTRVFVLLMVGDSLAILSTCMWRHPQKVRKSLSTKFRSHPPWHLHYGFTGLVVVFIILAIARWVLIGLKIDGEYTGSWYRVFAPIPVRLFFGLLESLIHGIYLRHLGARTTSEIVFTIFGSLFLNGIVCVSVYMLAVHLEGETAVKMADILIPIYVLVGYLTLASIYTVWHLLSHNKRLEEKENERRVLNPVTHDPFTGSRYFPMVGGIPVLMDDDKELVSVTEEEQYDEGEDDAELDEIEVDEEPEHFLDEPEHQHSPFEGGGFSDTQRMSRVPTNYNSFGGTGTISYNSGNTNANASNAVLRQRGVGVADGAAEVSVHNPYGESNSPHRSLNFTSDATPFHPTTGKTTRVRIVH